MKKSLFIIYFLTVFTFSFANNKIETTISEKSENTKKNDIIELIKISIISHLQTDDYLNIFIASALYIAHV